MKQCNVGVQEPSLLGQEVQGMIYIFHLEREFDMDTQAF